jgi:hypothetical protein
VIRSDTLPKKTERRDIVLLKFENYKRRKRSRDVLNAVFGLFGPFFWTPLLLIVYINLNAFTDSTWISKQTSLLDLAASVRDTLRTMPFALDINRVPTTKLSLVNKAFIWMSVPYLFLFHLVTGIAYGQERSENYWQALEPATRKKALGIIVLFLLQIAITLWLYTLASPRTIILMNKPPGDKGGFAALYPMVSYLMLHISFLGIVLPTVALFKHPEKNL